ncbi:mitochondrial carrier [Martensiomyces pterosporus]|nr:mitochondrial carrier [Martensiomyces pterosporus]
MSTAGTAIQGSKATNTKYSNKHVPAAVERHVEPWLHFVAGGLGGMAGAVATSPLDVLRTRQQLSGVSRDARLDQMSLLRRAIQPLTQTGGFLKQLYAREGVRGWFAGLGPSLAGIVPARAIQFFTYGNGKRVLAQWNGGKETPLVHLSAAAFAGIVTTTATNPIWMVKTRMQLLQGVYKNSLECLRAIIQNEGLLGLYKGTSAAYLGVSESAIQWMIYEQLKKALKNRQAQSGSHAGGAKTMYDWFEYFGAAASAKLCASVITYPHEVLRTRLRQPPDAQGNVKYRGLAHTVKVVYVEEGLRGLYGGLTAHLLRTVPNAAIMFLSYELVLHHFGTTTTKRE